MNRHIQSFDGARLAVWIDGPADRPAILFSHHLGGDAQGWAAQAAALAQDFRIVRYDSRGHGQSDAPDAPYNAAMLGRDALAVINALELGQVHMVGLSQGGMAGMWLAIHHPEIIHRLVLANTTPFIPNKPVWDTLIARARSEGMNAIADETIRSWLSDGFKARHPGQVAILVETMRAMKVAGYAGGCALLRDVDLRDGLAKIAAPTLVIGGAEDGPRGTAAPVMTAAIPGAHLVILPDAAHLSHVENPHAFNAALREHLS